MWTRPDHQYFFAFWPMHLEDNTYTRYRPCMNLPKIKLFPRKGQFVQLPRLPESGQKLCCWVGGRPITLSYDKIFCFQAYLRVHWMGSEICWIQFAPLPRGHWSVLVFKQFLRTFHMVMAWKLLLDSLRIKSNNWTNHSVILSCFSHLCGIFKKSWKVQQTGKC